jgi:hypothetical protein
MPSVIGDLSLTERIIHVVFHPIDSGLSLIRAGLHVLGDALRAV